MKQQKFLVAALAALFLAGCAGCSAPEEEPAGSGDLVLMTWNIHNLFDGEDNGYEYDEFLHSSGWSEEKYLGRINSITDAIGRIDPRPDIIMLQEIESQRVLEDLSRALGGFSQSHFAVNPGSATGLGIISRYPLEDVKTHSVTVNEDTAPRPVLEVRVRPQEARSVKKGRSQTKSEAGEDGSNSGESENSFIIFVCHWKSKIGGDEETEKTRRASARVILRRIRELRETERDTGVIIAGDLNQNYDEFYRQNASMICSLLPDDPFCAQTADGVQKDFIVISRNKPPVTNHFPEETISFYSPWINELENGSYFYRNDWETIDHFLISEQFFGGSSLQYEKTKIVDIAPFANAAGIPTPYNSRTGLGLSDHLPLLMVLKSRN